MFEPVFFALPSGIFHGKAHDRTSSCVADATLDACPTRSQPAQFDSGAADFVKEMSSFCMNDVIQ
jgi:hypothetical protein